jgi:PGF-pre-PGF domain-containing protein
MHNLIFRRGYKGSLSRNLQPMDMFAVATILLLALSLISLSAPPASAPLPPSSWVQTTWNGGQGQLAWSDATRYYAGENENNAGGELKLALVTYENGMKITGDIIGLGKMTNAGDNTSIRFTAQETKTVANVRVYVKLKSLGTATYVAGIQADNGSGYPTGIWLGSGAMVSVLAGWRNAVLTPNVSLTAGQVYHIVVNKSAGTSNVTLGGLNTLTGIIPYDGRIDENANTLFYDGTSWTENNCDPIYVLDYTDGTYRGQPYYDSVGYTFDSTEAEGERFTMGENKLLTKVGFWMKKIGSPPDNLYIILYDNTSGGNEFVLTATSAEFLTSFAWVTKEVSPAVQLVAGHTYYLYYKSPGMVDYSNCYSDFAVMSSAASPHENLNYYGDNSILIYSGDGGATWSGTDYAEMDIAFYMELGTYYSSGYIESSIYDAGSFADWKTISWSENKPSGTNIVVMVRTGPTSTPDGSWSGWCVHGNGNENTNLPNNRYAQYHVELSTPDNSKTPVLQDITIYLNHLPTTPTTLTLTSPVKVVDTLTATASGSTDADADGITYHYEFYDVTDSAIRQAYSITNTYLIAVGDAHDNIRVRAKAYDGSGYSGEMENSLIVQNTLPTTPTALALTSPVKVGDTLTATASGSTDADADGITYHYEFYDVTDSAIRQAYSITNTYLIAVGDAHDNIRVRAKAYDGSGYSGEMENSLIVQNTPPTASNQLAEGQINPPDLTTSTPTLSWTYTDSDSDAQTQRQIQVGTSENGNDLWDSTVSTSNNSATYAGSALSVGITYHWRVQVYDGYDLSSWLFGGTFRLIRAPISINGDANFTLANGVTGGTGTQLDPYIIENWVIDASSANGITIQNTNAYFIIRNCLVENGGGSYSGIYLDSVINGKVKNNICENNYNGIYLYDSYECTIDNNNCSNNPNNGIHLYECWADSLTNNTCDGNYDGIYIYGSDDGTVSNNTCSNNDDAGIYVDSSDYNILDSNTCESNDYGIYLYYSSNDNLLNNTCNNNDDGIYLYDDSDYNILDSNTCEGNNEGIHLSYSDYDNLLNNTCSNNSDYGIHLWHSDSNILDSNTCEGNSYGIYLSYSSYNNLLNNTCSSNGDYGIWLHGHESWGHSNYNILTNNNCSNNSRGIYMDYSDYNILDNNDCSNNDYGIYLDSSSYDNLYNNTCNNNSDTGIYLEDESDDGTVSNNTCENNDYGIYSSDSYSDIENNICVNNTSAGIYIWSLHGCTVSNNTCESNDNGIYLRSSNNNIIFHNYLLNNTTNNAYDDGTNSWDNNGEGNYWSDWQTPDTNNDGIVDVPRAISGGSNYDNYPLVLNWSPPTVVPTPPTPPPTPPTPPPSGFSISVSPASGTVQQGGTITATVTVTPFGDYNGSVLLSPSQTPGVSVSFSPSSGTPPFSSTMTVSAGSASVGSHFIGINGYGADGTFQSAGYSLTVTATESTIEVIEAGENGGFDFSGFDLPVSGVEISATGRMEGVMIAVEVLPGSPAVLPQPNFQVYSYLSITMTTSAGNIGGASINFKVPKSWIEQYSIDVDSIRLMKLNGEWRQLPTQVTGEDADYVYFVANTTGFSVFAIAGEEQAVVTPPTPTVISLSAPLIFLIAVITIGALMGAIVVHRRYSHHQGRMR